MSTCYSYCAGDLLVSPRRPSGSTLERRHTVVVEGEYNYVPYRQHVQPHRTGPTKHYQVPTQNREVAVGHYPPRPYAVVAIGSQPNLTSHNGPPVYDVPTETHRNEYHNIKLGQARSMPPLKEPAEMSPSHAGSKVAPLTAMTRQEAFKEGPVESLASNSSNSLQDNYTDAMAKALEQFDSLLQPPQGNKQIIQTSL